MTASTILNCNDYQVPHFQEPHSVPSLGEESHVWLYRLPSLSHFPVSLIEMLSEEEIERMNRYRKEADRCRFLFSHAIKRYLLSSYTGTVGSKIKFATGKNQKPFVPSSAIHFNLSHSGYTLAFIIDPLSDCGIDCETIRPDFDYYFFAAKNYHPNEIAALRNLHGGNQQEIFFKYWSRKEAWLKATGLGIFEGLSYMDTTNGSHPLVLPIDDTKPQFAPCYFIRSFLNHDAFVSFCVKSDNFPVIFTLDKIISNITGVA